jgi:hypothetical protein
MQPHRERDEQLNIRVMAKDLFKRSGQLVLMGMGKFEKANNCVKRGRTKAVMTCQEPPSCLEKPLTSLKTQISRAEAWHSVLQHFQCLSQKVGAGCTTRLRGIAHTGEESVRTQQSENGHEQPAKGSLRFIHKAEVRRRERRKSMILRSHCYGQGAGRNNSDT